MPLGDDTEASAALAAAEFLADLAASDVVEFVLFHVGGAPTGTANAFVGRPGRTVQHRRVESDGIESSILAEAATADAIVMATRGHDSLRDVLLGSHTDRVLHHAGCPVLSITVP